MPLAEDLGGILSTGSPKSDVSWLQGPGSWPRRAGNAPNTLLPPTAKGREAPSERPFYSDSQTKSFGGMGDGGEESTSEG